MHLLTRVLVVGTTKLTYANTMKDEKRYINWQKCCTRFPLKRMLLHNCGALVH